MATEVSFENIHEVFDLMERAVDYFEDKVVPIVQIKCKICGQGGNIEDLEEFARGAISLPDPFPLGARVVRRGLGWAGTVTENRVVILSGKEHKHRRFVTIESDNGSGRSFCQIEEGYNTCSESFILESEWKAQRGEGGG